MNVRAKFKVASYETYLDRGEEVRKVKLNVVVDGSPENKEFFRWTPSGQIDLGTVNRKAWEQFPLGREVYVEFSDATPSQEAADVRSTA